MNTQQAYDQWSEQYDTNENRTRDLEAKALREELKNISFRRCLEIGCGTGKNTEWLAARSQELVAVDLSEQMLSKAREKFSSPQLRFVQADINQAWDFAEGMFDLVSFSLMLEHIEHLDPVFQKAASVLSTGGHIYLGELHPFKQYLGSKARFETGEGWQVVNCFNHHISDFIQSAARNGLRLLRLNEYFDEGNREIPRLLTLVFEKK